ncbi:MAG: helix-turn-helix domain-containing protein [Paludibacter sp.]
MKYSELKELAESKNIMLKTLCERVGYTRAGLRPAIDNETIELRKLKLLCETLRITPAQFFDNGTYGLTITTGHVQAGNGNKIIIENKDKEIYMLREQLADKVEIIRMLRERLDLGIAATPKNIYGKK